MKNRHRSNRNFDYRIKEKLWAPQSPLQVRSRSQRTNLHLPYALRSERLPLPTLPQQGLPLGHFSQEALKGPLALRQDASRLVVPQVARPPPSPRVRCWHNRSTRILPSCRGNPPSSAPVESMTNTRRPLF